MPAASKIKKPAVAASARGGKVMKVMKTMKSMKSTPMKKVTGNEIRFIDHMDRTYPEFCLDMEQEYLDYKSHDESFRIRDHKSGRLALISLKAT